ncbi:glycosyltransferase WbsX family protein [Flavobacterium aquicola]|uniref:Glycosyl transferase family WbsX n=1 Tax=Flavobacterium aquicola TaxID=1682742 RepID=A0A3E0EJ96_9FLAO|nr:glycoside hydrolase family 99-like domain-containing protein [Flavobacterium aquicola]REG98268.1 glycosyl transferase family WbsX [Flavobacterium aquicola]
MIKKIKFLAYYLPQFHPIPENDLWWGKGFTEWLNVVKAKPLFKGHYQPILPADLGFYDLRVPAVQEEQSKMALEYGIDGFIYYQYWFGKDKMLLEGPAEAMLENKKITIPFCFCWANETWKGIWHGLHSSDVLIKQLYQGVEAYKSYFNYLLPFFKDERYIKIDSKPMFHIYKPEEIPDIKSFLKLFNDLAIENGFKGIHFIATISSDDFALGHNEIFGKVDSGIFIKMRYGSENQSVFAKINKKIKKNIHGKLKINGHIDERTKPLIFDYKKGVEKLNGELQNKKSIPQVFPNWDNTARSGKKALIFRNSTPHLWQEHLQMAVKNLIKNVENPQIVIIKSWNEWAEGNHLEPDGKFGRKWLEAVRNVKQNNNLL